MAMRFLSVLVLGMVFGLCSCATFHARDSYVGAQGESWNNNEIYTENQGLESYDDTKVLYARAPQEEEIVLQNLYNRDIVRCVKSAYSTANDCAAMFESQGFVRIGDIPQQTANYDLLKTNTYPTRRWREGEKGPRW